jgi:hypothetical protein
MEKIKKKNLDCSDKQTKRKQVSGSKETKNKTSLNKCKLHSKKNAEQKSQYIGPSKVIMLLKPRYLDAAPVKPCQQLRR